MFNSIQISIPKCPECKSEMINNQICSIEERKEFKCTKCNTTSTYIKRDYEVNRHNINKQNDYKTVLNILTEYKKNTTIEEESLIDFQAWIIGQLHNYEMEK